MSPARRLAYGIILAVLIIGGIVAGTWYYLYTQAHEWTDDAFIAGHLIQVSSRVPGTVLKVHFTDNQRVKQGDLLVEIDPRDFDVRLAQARAGLASVEAQKKTAETNVALVRTVTTASIAQAAAGVKEAEAGLAMAKAGLEATRATADRVKAAIDAAQADATRTESDLKRYTELFEKKQISPQQMDSATAAAKAAAAQLQAARKAGEAATAEITVYEAQVTQAEGKVAEYQAKLDDANAAPQRIAATQSQLETAASEATRLKALVAQAELELSYTRVVAPESGQLARKTVEEGNIFQAGQAMVSLVPAHVWVVANFKETSLGRLRVGQRVNIRVDAYPGRIFKGHIDSVQPGSGSVFSLLPPENATGNYVKVVQRMPVKIVFDDPDADVLLAPGMSVVPEVELKEVEPK
jgi:membrane fusion protein (multidrug efflux system)